MDDGLNGHRGLDASPSVEHMAYVIERVHVYGKAISFVEISKISIVSETVLNMTVV